MENQTQNKKLKKSRTRARVALGFRSLPSSPFRTAALEGIPSCYVFCPCLPAFEGHIFHGTSLRPAWEAGPKFLAAHSPVSRWAGSGRGTDDSVKQSLCAIGKEEQMPGDLKQPHSLQVFKDLVMGTQDAGQSQRPRALSGPDIEDCRKDCSSQRFGESV